MVVNGGYSPKGLCRCCSGGWDRSAPSITGASSSGQGLPSCPPVVCTSGRGSRWDGLILIPLDGVLGQWQGWQWQGRQLQGQYRQVRTLLHLPDGMCRQINILALRWGAWYWQEWEVAAWFCPQAPRWHSQASPVLDRASWSLGP